MHVVPDPHDHGDGPKPPEDAADPDRVADRLTQPVLLRDLEVAERRRVSANLDLVDGVRGSLQSSSAIPVSLNGVPRPYPADDGLRCPGRIRESLLVDVVEDDREAAVELAVRAQVGHDVPSELDAARSDDHHPSHRRSVPGARRRFARAPAVRVRLNGAIRTRGFSVVSAYILIQTEVGKASNVTREIGQIKGISSVDGVTGPYDVIARGQAADLDELAKAIVMPIQAVEGVTRTLTCPVLQL